MERAFHNSVAAYLTVVMLCLVSWPLAAQNAQSGAAALPASRADDESLVLLPVVSFRGDASGDELFDALKSSHRFAQLSKEAPGSPIQLRVYHSARPASVDAKNFFSGLLAVATLGLSPVIMSGEYTMHYELYVNGQRLSTYEYNAKLSRNEHLNGRKADPTHGLGAEGLVWAKSTVDLFLNDLAHDDSMRMLNDEYQVYFGALDSAGRNP
jgi:hypothetical protein